MIISVSRINSGKCPCWDVPVCVCGVYGEEPNGCWTFLRAECPIIENAKLPVYDQDERYKYMKCPDSSACSLYTQFQPLITSEK